MLRFLILSALFAGAALMAPVTMRADEHHDKRYYDREGHDYHTWDNNEDRAYRAYLGEQHQAYRAFAKVKAPQQREYFKWRHTHTDTALVKVEIK
jgi:hypothetical protein